MYVGFGGKVDNLIQYLVSFVKQSMELWSFAFNIIIIIIDV